MRDGNSSRASSVGHVSGAVAADGRGGAQANGPETLLVGRLRRWHRDQGWGFVYSDLHHADVLLEAASATRPEELAEGDFVLFTLAREDGERSAASARKASAEEVRKQQRLLEDLYRSQPLVTRDAEDAEPPLHPVPAPGGRLQPGVEASQRSLPPPPPPPVHPAPAGFPQQAMGQMVQGNQLYNQAQAYLYGGCFPQDPSHGQFMAGAWPGGDSVLRMTGLGTRAPQPPPPQPPPPPLQPLPGARILLEPPPALAARDPEAVKEALQSDSSRPFERPRLASASRTGVGSSLAAEWVAMLRQAVESVNQQQAGEEEHHHHHHHHHMHGWDGSSWDASGATHHGWQMDSGGDYGSAMGMVSPVMMGMHHGATGLYASTSAAG